MKKRLTLDRIRETLPELEELRPLLDRLLVRSEPDPTRTWSGSGRLGTVGSRVVARDELDGELPREVAQAEARHLERLYGSVARALGALADGAGGEAGTALLEAAALEEARERPERAAAYAAAAYRAARDERDQRVAALALRRWARATRSFGDLTEALTLYTKAYGAEQALGDPKGSAAAAVGAGNVLEEQGRWSEAANWYRTALAALDAVEGPASERWHALLNLHIVTRSAGQVEGSIPLLERAADAARGADAAAAEPFVQNAWGQLHMAQGRFREAEERLRVALDGAVGARARVTIRLNLAEALLAQERTLDAAEHAREAERDAIRAGLVPKLPEVYRLLGRIAATDGDADAFVFFERALELVKERTLPALEEALTLQAYADAEARRGEPEAARQLQETAHERFRALGMAQMRAAWADVYDGPTSAAQPSPEEERS